jgi:hypothetical protein
VVDVDTSAAAEPAAAGVRDRQAQGGVVRRFDPGDRETLQLALGGMRATVLQHCRARSSRCGSNCVCRAIRSAADDLEEIYVVGEQGQLVQLGALGEFLETTEPPTIYRKNLRRVVFVYGDVAGRPPADAILDMQFDQQPDGSDPQPAATIRPLAERTWFSPGGRDPWALPVGYSVVWTGEGEWKITLDVFRDLGSPSAPRCC